MVKLVYWPQGPINNLCQTDVKDGFFSINVEIYGQNLYSKSGYNSTEMLISLTVKIEVQSCA